MDHAQFTSAPCSMLIIRQGIIVSFQVRLVEEQEGPLFTNSEFKGFSVPRNGEVSANTAICCLNYPWSP